MILKGNVHFEYSLSLNALKEMPLPGKLTSTNPLIEAVCNVSSGTAQSDIPHVARSDIDKSSSLGYVQLNLSLSKMISETWQIYRMSQ